LDPGPAPQRDVKDGALGEGGVHRADLHLRPPVAGAPSLDFGAARDLVEVGYRSALMQMQEAGWADRQW
jgi:hypothetical protein